MEGELEILLALDGFEFEMIPGLIVEFSVRRTVVTPQRPHGISYAFVLRRKDGGRPWVRFDSAHSVDHGGRGYRRKRAAYDHWHRTETDEGRPYDFTTATQLLDDFWTEMRRTLNERGIQNDL
jgi:hypothetical protein